MDNSHARPCPGNGTAFGGTVSNSRDWVSTVGIVQPVPDELRWATTHEPGHHARAALYLMGCGGGSTCPRGAPAGFSHAAFRKTLPLALALLAGTVSDEWRSTTNQYGNEGLPARPRPLGTGRPSISSNPSRSVGSETPWYRTAQVDRGTWWLRMPSTIAAPGIAAIVVPGIAAPGIVAWGPGIRC